MGGPMRLRSRRAVRARRRPTRWHLRVIGGGLLVLIIGAACWAPLAPTALAPLTGGNQSAATPLGATTPAAVAALPAVAVPAVVSVAGVVATPVAVLPLEPVVVPTVTAAGQAVLDSVKADRTAQWVKNHTETPLRSGPSENAVVFTRLPQWTLLKQTESRPDWLYVQYSGDGDTRQAGPGWVKAGDVGGVDPPTVWLTSAKSGTVWSAADARGKRIVEIPAATLMEVVGPDFVQGTRAHVRLPGDGRTVPPTQGWVDGDVLARARTPSPGDLPWAYPDDLRADVRINVPYRTQLDGADYAGANCGPTVLGMALESFGMNLAPPDVRGQVLDSENFEPTDTDAGSFIWALANVAQSHGLQAHGLYEGDGNGLHRWSLDEIRASVRAGRPVIVQVVYRGLPGRTDSTYYGDHYVIVTGLMGDNFLYNDPIGGAVANESPGYDRMMTPTELRRAMRASDTGYQYTAFALARSY
ncbi:MAG: C39 family peptidase [Chloroflexi bacterium]|nr:C39 family peptidase [Chloroflexota bacterium]